MHELLPRFPALRRHFELGQQFLERLEARRPALPIRRRLSQLREHAAQSCSAERAPMPGSSRAMRLNATSSRGFTANFRNAATSLTCACSKNRRPLVIANGIAVPRQFHLQFHRVIMRAVEHRDLVQLDALLAQFQDALRDELRLLVGVAQRHQRRASHAAPRARRCSSLWNCRTLPAMAALATSRISGALR